MFEIHVPIRYLNEIKWVFDWVFGRTHEFPYRLVPGSLNLIEIRFQEKMLTLPVSFFELSDQKWLNIGTLPNEKLQLWTLTINGLTGKLINSDLPVLFGTPGFEKISDNHWRLNLDIIGSCFFMLSRYEEFVVRDRDQHNRFPSKASCAYKGNFLERPICDEYVELLFWLFREIWPSFVIERKPYGVQISHDVDVPSMFAFQSTSQVIKSSLANTLRGRIKTAFLGPYVKLSSQKRISKADPCNTFDWIMDSVEKQGLKSTYYFLCGKHHEMYDGAYQITNPNIVALLGQLLRRGHEVGLHPSYLAAENQSFIFQEKANLVEALKQTGYEYSDIGARMHYLRWLGPLTWKTLSEAGIVHDASLGYADHIGFRAGTCHPYKAYDVADRKEIDLEVRPLIAMEVSFIDQCYMGLGTDDTAYSRVNSLRDACKRVQGTFTLLWHNSRLVIREERNLFGRLIETMF